MEDNNEFYDEYLSTTVEITNFQLGALIFDAIKEITTEFIELDEEISHYIISRIHEKISDDEFMTRIFMLNRKMTLEEVDLLFDE